MKTRDNAPPKSDNVHQTCPFCGFAWTGPKARRSNQCPRCHKTIWHELTSRSLMKFR
jgi:hypothetical protein